MLESITQKIKGNPIILVVAAAALSGTVILGYKRGIEPYFERRRRIQAELMADYLFEKESRRQ